MICTDSFIESMGLNEPLWASSIMKGTQQKLNLEMMIQKLEKNASGVLEIVCIEVMVFAVDMRRVTVRVFRRNSTDVIL